MLVYVHALPSSLLLLIRAKWLDMLMPMEIRILCCQLLMQQWTPPSFRPSLKNWNVCSSAPLAMYLFQYCLICMSC